MHALDDVVKDGKVRYPAGFACVTSDRSHGVGTSMIF